MSKVQGLLQRLTSLQGGIPTNGLINKLVTRVISPYF